MRTPFSRLYIEGHTSEVNPNMNYMLSQHRAEAIRIYLIERGLPADRLVAVGKGATELLKPGDNPYNMRVVLRLSN